MIKRFRIELSHPITTVGQKMLVVIGCIDALQTGYESKLGFTQNRLHERMLLASLFRFLILEK